MVAGACNPSYSGGRGCSDQDHTTALQPGQQSKTPPQKKKKVMSRDLGVKSESTGHPTPVMLLPYVCDFTSLDLIYPICKMEV